MTTAKVVAEKFLRQWEKAHSVDRPDYDKLRDLFATYTGGVSMGFAEEVRKALHSGRVARGWPEPGEGRIRVTIEAAIMSLWFGGLRQFARSMD